MGKTSFQITRPIMALDLPAAATNRVKKFPTASRRLWPRMLAGGFLMAALVIGLLSTAGLAWFWQSGVLLPGISVLSVEVGGLDPSSAAAVLERSWRQQTIALEADGFGVLVSPEALGMTFDAAATADLARQYSRSPRRWRIWLENHGTLTVPPVWEFNQAQAESGLEALSLDLTIPAKDADLEIVNGRVVETPPVIGQALDVAVTLAVLSQNPAQVFLNGRLPLVVEPVFPAVTDIHQAAGELEDLLQTAVTLQAYDPITDEIVTRPLEPAVWGDWLAWHLNPDGSLAGWSLDDDRLQAFLTADWGNGRFVAAAAATAVVQSIASRQGQVDLRLLHPQQQYVVQSGETLASIGRKVGIPYPWIQQANPGLPGQLRAGQALTLPSPDVMLPLPVVKNKRIVVSLSRQRLWAYEDGQVKWEWSASTGIDSSPTSPGIFQVQSHEPNAFAANWDLWMPGFMGIYRPVPTADFMNGFHGFPTRDGVNLLWTGNLGSQVTYGCIMVSNANIARLYDWAETGTIVAIQP